MAERSYTVSEIDKMRKALKQITPDYAQYSWAGSTNGCYSDSALRHNEAMRIMSRAYDAAREEELRTYMLGGVDPEELEAKAAEAIQSQARRISETIAPLDNKDDEHG